MRVFYAPFYDSDYIVVEDEVAYDNSSGVGYAPKITMTPDVGGYYLVVVHANRGANQGIGDLWFNGSVDESSIQIGGEQFYSCELRNGDVISSVFEPISNGAGNHQMIVSQSSTGPANGFRQDNSPSGGRGVEYIHNGGLMPECSSVIISSAIPSSGEITQVWNEVIDDDDGDGIGNLLEEAIGTCPNSLYGTVTKDGWECDKYSTLDTDHDGISDYNEFFGVAGTSCTTNPLVCIHRPTPLRWWGANPTQKDVFIEVKYEVEYTSGGLKDDFTYSDMAGIYNAFSEGDADDLENPNGQPGVRLHFEVEDANVVDFPGNPAFVFFGDESGYNYLGGDDQGSGFVEDCTSFTTARTNLMLERRKPFFRFMCGQPSGGKAALGGAAFRANVSNRLTITHEIGHVLGLGHGGYDGVNGKPNYRSIMNYAFDSTYKFSSAASNTLNPTSLCEDDGLGPNSPYSYLAGTPFYYKLAEYSGFYLNIVDWNRDNDFSDCNETVRAPITWASTLDEGLSSLGQAQEKLNLAEITPNGATGTPSLVRMNVGGMEMMYMLYSDGEYLKYRFTEFPNGCVGDVSKLKETSCGDWSDLEHGLYFAHSVSSRPFVVNGFNSIIAVTTTEHGVIRVFRYDPSPSTKKLGVSVLSNNLGVADGEVAVEKRGQELVIVWKNIYNEIEEVVMDSSGQFSSPQTILDSNGNPWLSNAAPALAVNSYLSWIYMVITNSNDRMEVLWRNNQGAWRKSGSYELPNSPDYETLDQPGFAWQPYNRVSDPTGPGHFWIAFPKIAASRRIHAVQLPQSPLIPVIGQMHNQWTYSKVNTSVELLHVEGEDNMRAAFISHPDEDKDQVRFFPFADGVFDFDLRGANDFKVMAAKICGGLQEDSGLACGSLQGAPQWMSWYYIPGDDNYEEGEDCY